MNYVPNESLEQVQLTLILPSNLIVPSAATSFEIDQSDLRGLRVAGGFWVKWRVWRQLEATTEQL